MQSWLSLDPPSGERNIHNQPSLFTLQIYLWTGTYDKTKRNRFLRERSTYGRYDKTFGTIDMYIMLISVVVCMSKFIKLYTLNHAVYSML